MSCGQVNPQKDYKLRNYKNISVLKPKECIFCKSKEIIKWSFRFNHTTKKQRWKCNFCNKLFTVDDGFFHLHKKRELLTTCLDLYMNGLSLRKIRNHIKQFTEQGISHMQILRWIIKYSQILTNYTRNFEPQLSGVYHADEIFIKCNKQQHYLFDMIDKGTRFLISSYYSTKRDSKSAKILFIKAKHKPLTLFTDSLQAYRKAYRKVWGARTNREDKETYIRLKADKDKRNNIVERIQGTIRERIKVIRGFKNKESAEHILNLFLIWYYFIRVHQGINMTPAQKAGINLNLNQNKWLDLIYSSKKN